jgi:hypothetical protein
MSNPFHPFFIISWFAPLAVFNSPYFQLTDPLGRNAYFGIIPLFFTISAFFFKTNNKWIRFSKWGFIFSLVFSFGELGLIRPLTYYILPLMDTFRHPSSARLFTTLFACILCASLFDEILKKPASYKAFFIVFRVIFVIYCILACWTIIEIINIHSGSNEISASASTGDETIGYALKSFIKNIRFHELLLINIILQLPFIYLLWQKGLKEKKWAFVTRGAVVNSVLIAALLMPFAVVKKDYAGQIQKTLSGISVRGYPLPDLSKSLAENAVNDKHLFDKIGPANMYNKKISRTDYYITPSNLLTQREFWSDSILRTQIMSKSLLFADCEATIHPTEMNPNVFAFRVHSTRSCYYTLVQNYYPGWEVWMDGNKMQPGKTSRSFMGVKAPEGSHEIKFKFRPLLPVIFFWISLVMLAGIIIYSVTVSFKPQHHRTVG